MLFSKKRSRSQDEIDRIKSESTRMLNKHPNRVIIYVDKYPNSKNKNILPSLKNNKFLVPDEFNFGQFSNIIRKNLNFDSTQGLFYFVGKQNTIPPMTKNLGELYNEHKDEDGRMYVYYEMESVFG